MDAEKASLGIFLPLHFLMAPVSLVRITRRGLDRDFLMRWSHVPKWFRSDLAIGHSNLILLMACLSSLVRHLSLPASKAPSHVFGGTYDLSSDLSPVNA
jgi:hypothetical protein